MNHNDNNYVLNGSALPSSQNKAPKKNGLIFAIISLILIACIVFVVFKFVIPDNKSRKLTTTENYLRALEYIDDNDFDKAYKLLQKCGNYKDSKELLQNFIVSYENEEFSAYNNSNYLEYTYGTKFKYIYNSKGALKHIEWYDEDGNLCNTTTLTYHNNGVLSGVSHFDHKNDTMFYKQNEYDEHGSLISSAGFDNSTDYSLSSAQFEYDENGRIILETERQGYNKIIKNNEYEYDDKGNMIRKTEYSTESKLAKNVHDYEYDSDNKLILEHISFVHSFATYEESYEYEYEYDKRGNLTRVVLNDEIVISEAEYDKKGNITSKRDYSKDGLLTTEIMYENGSIKREKFYDEDEILVSEKEYDDGNLILEITYLEDGTESVKSEYEYTRKGNEELHTITSYGGITFKSVFSNPTMIYCPKNTKVLGELLNGYLYHSY